MFNKSFKRVLPAILMVVLLSGCAGGAGTTEEASPPPETTEPVPMPSDTAMPPLPEVTAPPLPTATETATPTLFPPGPYSPLPPDQCELLRAAIQESLGVPATLETVAFTDYITSEIGAACRVLVTGTGLDFDNPQTPYTTISNLLIALGWVEDMMYGAAGATGLGIGFRKENALALLASGWRPAPGICPTGQPITMCELQPEQRNYTITVDFAQK